MKYKLFLSIGLGIGIFLGLCLTLFYHHTQKAYFNKITVKHHSLQKKLRTLKDDLDFLKQNHDQLNYLIKKEWFLPQNRLRGGEQITQWAASLNAVRLTIEPECITEIENEYFFKKSKIIIDIDALLDNYIYDFLDSILKKFPGILILRKISVSRHAELNRTNLLGLQEKKRPHFVIGEIICEWFSMEDKSREDH